MGRAGSTLVRLDWYCDDSSYSSCCRIRSSRSVGRMGEELGLEQAQEVEERSAGEEQRFARPAVLEQHPMAAGHLAVGDNQLVSSTLTSHTGAEVAEVVPREPPSLKDASAPVVAAASARRELGGRSDHLGRDSDVCCS